MDFVYILISLIFLGIDQFLKHISFNSHCPGLSTTINKGIAFGIGNSLSFFNTLTIIIYVLAFVFFIFLRKKEKGTETPLYKFFFYFLLGGILSNLVDRVTYGYVIDYIDLCFWPVFNIADSMIFISLVFIAIYYLKKNKNKLSKL